MVATLAKVEMIKWKLRSTMEKHRITNVELAKKLGRKDSAIARLKKMEYLPAIGAAEIEKLAVAITELLEERGLGLRVTSSDLIDSSEDR